MNYGLKTIYNLNFSVEKNPQEFQYQYQYKNEQLCLCIEIKWALWREGCWVKSQDLWAP